MRLPAFPGCHPVPMLAGDDPYPPAHDLSAYRRARQERADQALITLFASVLGKPLVLREFTPEQHARREARLRARSSLRGWGHDDAGGAARC